MAGLCISSVEGRLRQLAPRVIPPDLGPRRAAVAIVLREAGGSLEMLFIKRARHDEDPWSGHMAFPGGRMEEQDADPRAVAVRETREEVGIDLAASGRLLGTLDDLHASAGGRILPIAVTPHVFALDRPGPEACSPEVDEIHWIAARDLLDPARQSTTPYTLRGTRFDLPCIRVHDRVIWGLTYQMLMRFFSAAGWEIGASAQMPLDHP